MYYYLKGQIKHIGLNFIVIDVNGIGFKVFVSHVDDFFIDESTKVFTHQVIREDEHFLVGFVTIEEQTLFNKLIQVKGIGPKTAINALGDTTPEKLMAAIANNDIAYLKKLPGIGPKAASQIILDLKGELEMSTNKSQGKISQTKLELKDALKNFGYKSSEIERVLPSISDHLSLEEMVKAALSLLRK